MSYILDALKRAESERERGGVPGLHSQPEPLRRPIAVSRAVVKPLVWAGVALALALSGVLVWRSAGFGLVPGAVGAGMPGIAASPPIANLITGSAGATVAKPVASAAFVVITAPAVAGTANMALPAPAPVTKAVAASPMVKQAASVASLKPDTRSQSVTAVAAAPAPATARIVPVGELPPDIRQTLPKVVISGSIYSDNQALRMLIINGEVFREGEKPVPDLQLEQIRVKSAVLNFKGLRYSVVY